MAKQRQHYVPQFILRQFLCDAEKEHVAVYDKHDDKNFVTSIKNIMAERSFHDLSMDGYDVSFEPVASKIEEVVLPFYRSILETGRLTQSAEEVAALAYLIAFQFVRTKAHRHLYDEVETAVRQRVEAMGRRMDELKGWESPTEETKKRNHLTSIISNVDRFAPLIAQKHMLLLSAGDDRGFYLGDHPVSLHNTRQFGPYGNLGLAVPGIEIYMPLSSDILLGAWCPSILDNLRERRNGMVESYERETLSEVLAGRVTVRQMREVLTAIKSQFANADAILTAFDTGTPLRSTSENMDYYNSIQSSFAFRYVIDKQGNFDVAKRHNREFPKFRTGHRPTAD